MKYVCDSQLDTEHPTLKCDNYRCVEHSLESRKSIVMCRLWSTSEIHGVSCAKTQHTCVLLFRRVLQIEGSGIRQKNLVPLALFPQKKSLLLYMISIYIYHSGKIE